MNQSEQMRKGRTGTYSGVIWVAKKALVVSLLLTSSEY